MQLVQIQLRTSFSIIKAGKGPASIALPFQKVGLSLFKMVAAWFTN